MTRYEDCQKLHRVTASIDAVQEELSLLWMKAERYVQQSVAILGRNMRYCCAGQVEQPRQGGKHAKPHKHTSPFRKPPEDKPFPSFPASPAPAMNGMHPGSAATSGNAVPASSSTPSPTLPRSLESAFNGMHAGMAAKSGSAGQGAAADMAAQLPPRFTSAVNISEGAFSPFSDASVGGSAAQLTLLHSIDLSVAHAAFA